MIADKEGIWLWKSFDYKKERAIRVTRTIDGELWTKLGFQSYKVNVLKRYGTFLLWIHHDPYISSEVFAETELAARLHKVKLTR